MKCPDCGSYDICDIHGESTCKGCGLVISVDYMDYSFDYDNQYVMNNSNAPEDVALDACDGLIKSDEMKQFEVTCQELRLPLVIASAAIDIFGSFVEKHVVKGVHRGLCMMACLYYAQYTTNNGITVSKPEICKDKGFPRACSEIEEHMRTSSKWRRLSGSGDISRSIGRIMTDLGVHASKQSIVRPLAITIYDKSKGYSGLVGVKDTNYYMACIYIACEIKKIGLENKKMVKVTNQKIVGLISKALK